MPKRRTSTRLSSSVAKEPVFSVGAETYTAADVILAAQNWHDWAPLEQATREGIVCVKHARATQEPKGASDVEAAANVFREERELHEAEVAENWLQARHVSFLAWMQYIRRSVLRIKWASSLPRLLSEYPVSQEQVNRNIRIEGMCSGYVAVLARKLASRAAVQDRIRKEAGSHPGDGQLPNEEAVASASGDFTLNPQEVGISPEEAQKTLQRLARLDLSIMQFRSQMLTEENIRRKISAYQLDWIRIQASSVSFRDESHAREAALCVREDGEDLNVVAARARTALRQERLRVGDLDPGLQAAFLTARMGKLIGPIRSGQEFKLYHVLDKQIPSVDIPEVRTWAEKLILQSAVKSEVDARVHWLASWWSDACAESRVRL
jgi:hypothetical protein